MASASRRPKRASKEVDAEALDAFLKDSLFVEYFNAFLSLPTFSFKVKYDPECGEFVELCSPPVSPSHAGQSTVSLISSEVSLLSLGSDKQYTTKPLDPARGRSWVLMDRLPLFLRSDLYSEYRLCRLMDQPPALGEESLVGKTQSLKAIGSSDQLSADAVCECVKDDCCTESEVRGGESADLEGNPPHKRIMSLREAHSLRHFLREKTGERNWLFWIEAERMKHLKKEEERAKCMKQLRHKYFRSGSQHQLPSEVLSELGMTKSSRFSADKLAPIQAAMVVALRCYWYPSFLLHVACEERRREQEEAEPQVPEMKYMGPQPALSRAMSADRLSRVVSLRNRSTSSTGCRGNTPQGGRPRSFSASEVTLRVEDFLSKTKMRGMKKGAGRKLGQLKECKWANEAKTVPTHGGRSSVGQEAAAGETHWIQSAPVKDRSSRRLPAKQDPPSPFPAAPSSPGSKLPCVSGPASPSLSSASQGDPPCGEDYRRLLKCLALEQWKAGGCFQQFLERQGADTELCLHCLAFWREVQLFKKHFYSPIFTPTAVETRAKELHSTFIAEGASFSIQCPPEVRRVVQRSLWPAFEELFDVAEEHALGVLVGRWREMEQEEESKVASGVLKKGRRTSKTAQPSGESNSSDHVMKGGQKGNYGNRDEAPDKPWTLLDVLTSPTEREYFKVFLNQNMAALDLMCWTEIESFRALPANDTVLRNAKARQIKSKFLCKKYFFAAGSPASKEQQKQVIACQGGAYTYHLPARPSSPVFREAQKYVRARLEKKWVPLFTAQPDFLARTAGGSRKEKGSYIPTIAPGSKTLETEIALQSHDAILLRKSLQEADVRQQFSTYLSIVQLEGEPLTNNVLFWVEVQRFKAMYHNHTTMGVLGRKMRAILSSFLLSATPPKVQVSVPSEVADQTILKMDKMGPYIFREAQMAVFRSLLTYWVDFTDFAGGTPFHRLCFDELRQKKARQAEAARRRAEAEQAEMERQLSMQPRFETFEEKQQRLAKKREEKEMSGRVAISFSLCQPTERAFQSVETQTMPTTPTPMDRYGRGVSALKQNGRRVSAPALSHTPSCFSNRQLADSSRPISTLSSIVNQSEMSPEVPTTRGSPAKPRSRAQSQMGMGTADSPLFMTQLQWYSPKQRPSVPPQTNKKTPRRGSKTGPQQTELSLSLDPAMSNGGQVQVKTSEDGRNKLMNWSLSSPHQNVLFGSGIQASSVLACTEETVQ